MRVYQEGRDAFRSSVPYLRTDSVDAESIFDLGELEEGEQGESIGRRVSLDGTKDASWNSRVGKVKKG